MKIYRVYSKYDKKGNMVFADKDGNRIKNLPDWVFTPLD